MSEREYPTQGTVGPPDLSGLVSEMAWRQNSVTGFDELIRRRDGQVIDRRPTARRPVLSPAPAREVTMQEPIEIKREQPSPGGELEILGRGEKSGYSKVKHACGATSEVQTYRLESGAAKGFRHDCPLKPRRSARKVKRKPTLKRMPAKAEAPAVATAVAVEMMPAVNFALVTDAVDAVTKLARMIPLAQVAAVAAEIEQFEAALPASDWGRLADLRAQLAEGKRTATAFLAFRRAIDEVES